MGHKVMTYELTASDFQPLPVSSVGHCRVRPAERVQVHNGVISHVPSLINKL